MRRCNAVLFGAGALVLSIALAASAAEAQEVVGIRLEAPAGHPGFGAFGVRLLKGGTTVGALDRTSIVSGGPASIRFTVSAADVPDAVELDFAVPFDGARTLYSVSGLDFAFDRAYLLPNPSPGGLIGRQTGDAEADAFFELSLVHSEIPEDQTSPTCVFSRPERGVIEATLRDQQSGLESVDVIFARNLTVEVPSFAPGTTEPVTVVARIDSRSRTAVLALRAIDGAGNRSVCKKIESRRLRIREHRLTLDR
jgi:hypothetical protein